MSIVGPKLPLVALCVAFLAGDLCAQASGATASADAVFQGQVLDELTETPVAGVLVRLDTGAEAVTGRDGRFRVGPVPPGRHLYALLTSDCEITWGQVDLTPAETHEARLTVAAGFASAAAAQQEESRRTRSKGKFLTGAEIDELHATSMAEVIRRVAPTMVMGAPEEAGGITQLTSRGSNSIVSRSVPIVVIDGMRMDDGASALNNVRPSEVETLEILPGAAGGWEFGSSGSGGVIKVTTGRSGASALSTDKACVVPDFPGR